jgi:hypothetical protein
VVRTQDQTDISQHHLIDTTPLQFQPARERNVLTSWRRSELALAGPDYKIAGLNDGG